MNRNSLLLVLFTAAVASMICGPSVGQDTFVKASYSVIDAKRSDKSYEYLTIDSIMNQIKPEFKKLLPDPASAKLVMLQVTFKTDGDVSKGNELDPTHLELEWTVDDVKGKAPVVGVHLSKDFIIMGSGSGFFTSMRPDTYEVFGVVPKAVRQISLAQRISDGTYRVVKSGIPLESVKKR